MEIIVKPIVSEKMTDLTDKKNQYGFVVNTKANKIQIKEAIEDKYSVTVMSVNTLVVAPKSKSRFTKNGLVTGKTKRTKKAYVTLSEGENIDFFTNV